MTAVKKINLIYIVSTGHSGSTLLDLLLGLHPDIWTLGEFQVLPWEARLSLQPCGCGEEIVKCSFWKPILEKHRELIEKGSIHRFREQHGSGRILRFSEMIKIRNANFKPDPMMTKYGEDNYTLLSSIISQVETLKGKPVSWLVDASKDLYRLFWLQKSGYFNIKVIHLLKDPRAFVYSMVKKETQPFKRWLRTLRMSLRYIVQNSITSTLLAKHFQKESVQLLKYEELAGNPQWCYENLCRFIGLPAISIEEVSEVSGQHSVAGNQMRFQMQGIRPDEKWKENLNPSSKRFVSMVTSSFAKRYGYETSGKI